MHNILVATDLSDAIAELIESAKMQALKSESKIWLVFAAPPNPDFVGLEIGPKYIRDNVAAELREDHKKLQDIAESLRLQGYQSEALMVQGPAPDVILAEADKLEANMIVIGSHGHGAVFDLLVGSVCKGVLKKSKIPVLVVPSKQL